MNQFKQGQRVRSRVNTQGMHVGQQLEVVEVRERHTFVGGFTSLVLRCEESGRVLDRPVGNPHLVVEVVS